MSSPLPKKGSKTSSRNPPKPTIFGTSGKKRGNKKHDSKGRFA